MANIDPAAPVGPELDAAGGDGNQEVFDMNAYRSNLRKIDKIRSFMGIASGCVAGICGLTGLSGLGELMCVWYMIFGVHLLGVCRSGSITPQCMTVHVFHISISTHIYLPFVQYYSKYASWCCT